jgi:predicted translin family RNA/ssDNA-binding protein
MDDAIITRIQREVLQTCTRLVVRARESRSREKALDMIDSAATLLSDLDRQFNGHIESSQRITRVAPRATSRRWTQ